MSPQHDSITKAVVNQNSKKPLILIVEDNELDVLFIKRALSKANINAELKIAGDGEEAIRAFNAMADDKSRSCPDLILLDVNLPVSNGLEVLKHIRTSQCCCQSPVIMVTSSDLPEERAFMKKWDADGYFQKVSNIDEFMELGPYVQRMLYCALH